MTILICEGIKVRVDDPWNPENNGKEFYLNLNLFNGQVPSIPEEMSVEDLNQLQMMFKLNNGFDYSGKIKDAVIESAITILKRQKESGTRPKGKTAALVSAMTGISENYVREYCKANYPIQPRFSSKEEDQRKQKAKRIMKTMRTDMRYIIEHLEAYDWATEMHSLSGERQLAEELIKKLQKNIIEGDEKMKKMTVDYLLEDNQCEYLERIHQHYPQISEEDLFLMIMIEGSALEINQKLQRFCIEHQIDNKSTYLA